MSPLWRAVDCGGGSPRSARAAGAGCLRHPGELAIDRDAPASHELPGRLVGHRGDAGQDPADCVLKDLSTIERRELLFLVDLPADPAEAPWSRA